MSNALDLFRQAKQEVPDIKFTIPSTGEDIFLRPFTTREQKAILKAIEKEDQVLINEAFDQLIINCVVSKGFNIDSLLTKDRDAILIELRKESVKDDFNFHWKCSHCDHINKDTMSLDKLKFKKLKDKDLLSKEIELNDRTGLKLNLSLPSRKFEKMLYKHVMKDNKKDISAVDVLNTTLAVSIDSLLVLDEETNEYKRTEISFTDRINILEEVCIDDKKKIEKFLEGIEAYGYDMNIGNRVCKECKESSPVELEWSDFFLV